MKSSQKNIDLRSDTVTQPTSEMREAMARAVVGDDVFGEDPTVNRLETMAADIMGKEAALFVTSGTMANLVCQLTHCGRGDEMILGDQSHIFYYEQGGCSALGGIHPRILPNNPDGTISLDAIAAAIRPDNIHFPRTRLIALENTHNRCNGHPLAKAYMDRVGTLAHEHGLKLHVDGARIFNAAVALGIEARDLVEKADSVSFCLSKGLTAPVGSLVCGTSEFIDQARRYRKVLGGGMRQAGVVAAAGIYALENRIPRLAQDHDHARQLAMGLAEIDGIAIDPESIKTNIVFFEIVRKGMTAEMVTTALSRQGIHMLPLGAHSVRAVTHFHITTTDVVRTLDGIKRVFS